MGEALTKNRKSRAGCLRFLVKFEVIAEYLGMPEAVRAVSSMRGESGVEASGTEARVAFHTVDQAVLGGQSPALTPSTTIQDPSNGYGRLTTRVIHAGGYPRTRFCQQDNDSIMPIRAVANPPSSSCDYHLLRRYRSTCRKVSRQLVKSLLIMINSDHYVLFDR